MRCWYKREILSHKNMQRGKLGQVLSILLKIHVTIEYY